MRFLVKNFLLQDSGLYGYNGGVQGSRLSKNVQKGGITSGRGNQSSLNSPSVSRSSSMRLYGSSGLVTPNEPSPGLFDLSSFDTELLSEVCRLVISDSHFTKCSNFYCITY